MAQAVSGCEVWQQDLLAMTLPTSSFDGVFANAVLFHVPSRALPVVLDGLHAALKSGGVLLVSNPRGQDEEGFVDGPYACFYSFKTWHRLVSCSGFALVDHYFRPTGKPRRQHRGSPRSGASQHRPFSPAVSEARASTRRCATRGFSDQRLRVEQDRARSERALADSGRW